jgi:hypothetical protein
VRGARGRLFAFVDAAVRAGELRGDSEMLSLLVETAYNGSLYLWLVDRQGTAWDYFEPRLTALLAPYRPTTSSPRKRRPRRAPRA